MIVGSAKSSSTIGRRKRCSCKRFHVDQIYFSDERIEPAAIIANTVRIARHSSGLRISARSVDGRCNIDIAYSELKYINIIEPDKFTLAQEKQSRGAADVLMGWVGGLRSLRETRLVIGGSVEFYYADGDAVYEVSLHHSKQALFDLFGHVRNQFGKYIIDA